MALIVMVLGLGGEIELDRNRGQSGIVSHRVLIIRISPRDNNSRQYGHDEGPIDL